MYSRIGRIVLFQFSNVFIPYKINNIISYIVLYYYICINGTTVGIRHKCSGT